MRLPRKRKKEVNKIVAKKTASKMVMTALVTASAAVQNAMIISRPTPYFSPVTIAEKSLAVVRNVVDTAQAIKQIFSEKPNHWTDFIKPTI